MYKIINWRKLIASAMQNNGETIDDIVSNTLTEEQMNVEFDDGYGSVEGEPFTVWTKNYVYFPVMYDGAEWAGSVPRNPNGAPTEHVGSG